MTSRTQLLRDIEVFLAENDMRATTFGKLAINDPALLLRMKTEGRDLRLDTAERIRKFMATYKKPKRRVRPSAARARVAVAA